MLARTLVEPFHFLTLHFNVPSGRPGGTRKHRFIVSETAGFLEKIRFWEAPESRRRTRL